jgi:hypothetical protein
MKGILLHGQPGNPTLKPVDSLMDFFNRPEGPTQPSLPSGEGGPFSGQLRTELVELLLPLLARGLAVALRANDATTWSGHQQPS